LYLEVKILSTELVILIGIQAAGKSTFFRTHFADTHEHVSKDRIRNNRNRTRQQTQLIEAALQAGKLVVVDNTNATVEARAPLISLGRMYGAQIVGYYFEPQLKESLERNKQREGKARVPDVAIFVTLKKLVRPSYAEGFDKLFDVRVGEDGGFVVREWTEQQAITEGPTPP